MIVIRLASPTQKQSLYVSVMQLKNYLKDWWTAKYLNFLVDIAPETLATDQQFSYFLAMNLLKKGSDFRQRGKLKGHLHRSGESSDCKYTDYFLDVNVTITLKEHADGSWRIEVDQPPAFFPDESNQRQLESLGWTTSFHERTGPS